MQLDRASGDLYAALSLAYPGLRMNQAVQAGLAALVFNTTSPERAAHLERAGYLFELAPRHKGRAVRIRCVCHREVHNKENVVARIHDSVTQYWCERGLTQQAQAMA